jgi:hypothetical protein
LYQGRAGAAAGQAPGGFGTVLYTATGGTATASTFGGAGGRGGAAGGTGSINVANPGGIIAQTPRRFAVATTVKFPVRPTPPAELLPNLQLMIGRTTAIANPQGVQVVLDGPAVVLRGTVRDEDEARLVEGMIRLTPGVGEIRNELLFPRQP